MIRTLFFSLLLFAAAANWSFAQSPAPPPDAPAPRDWQSLSQRFLP